MLAGLQTNVSTSVFVEVPPTAFCRGLVSVLANTNCQATVGVAQIQSGASGIAPLPFALSEPLGPDPTNSYTNLALTGVGPHSVALTVTDGHGYSGSCTSLVNVLGPQPLVTGLAADSITSTSAVLRANITPY